MKVVVAAETRDHERRVALVPDLVGRLTSAGLEVAVESGAGLGALHPDEAYEAAGATIVRGDVLTAADVVLSVQPLPPGRLATLRSGVVTVSLLPVTQEPDVVRAARDAGVTAFSLELVPRISRAQSMDALTSQALVAGYRAVLVAAEKLPRFFPLSMTAAGTIPPAEVLVLGAGVAGLQAIATARRLGARVQAYDVRAASADEVRSLGAQFVELDLPSLEGAGGYAREMTEERAQLQRDLLAPYVSASDVLITTAAVPGRTAPLLVERPAVEAMKPGSVVVDLAAESGGNVEGSVPGEEIVVGGALLWGARNVPSQLPVHASRLFAANVVNLVLLMTADGKVTPDFADEIVDGAAVTHDGVVRHAPTRELLEAE
ncbi:NAD(P) transhydrogenase subunit alpha [Jiangella rhizosphaerae]|uniref:proton-translocating NAD(P)(+) transhydrogenase n=1 Tax=Jiangella rhizosphaerae TaxID=2293569 RepID=A0A418KN20_9ACTN|nr:NAD(P) transhydrogenase subunit alpha [Jiangella rhizosphaerae]RIQ20355.1 NAD(P) transhydrogenase subunit alpha [Jiangella rhizosphaerae]